jgi:hypothetical protein
MSDLQKKVQHSSGKTKAPSGASGAKGKLSVPEVPTFKTAPQGATSAGWHSIESFLRCPKEYQFRQIRGLRVPSSQTPDYFAVGQLFHIMKAAWYESSFKQDDATLDAIRRLVAVEAAKAPLPITLEAERAALHYFEEYVEHWGPRTKPQVVAAEYDLGPAPLMKDDPPMLWRTARIDDVSRYAEAGGKLAIGEAKTTSTSINDTVQQYTLHGQPLLQALLWKNSKQGEATHGPIAGVVLDVVQKGYGGKRSQFARVFIETPERALKWFAVNLRAQLRAATLVDWNAEAPRHIHSCTRLVGRARVACEFRDLCMRGRSASVKYVMKDGSSLLNFKPDDERKVMPWD